MPLDSSAGAIEGCHRDANSNAGTVTVRVGPKFACDTVGGHLTISPPDPTRSTLSLLILALPSFAASATGR